MRIEFGSVVAANKFYKQMISDGYELEIAGQNYAVCSCSMRCEYGGSYVIEMDIHHMPIHSYPTWQSSEEDLKDLRQKNTNLKAFFDAALKEFVQSGNLSEYLKNHEPNGLEK